MHLKEKGSTTKTRKEVMSLKLHNEELGRFLVAYYRGNIFPPNMRLGACFLLFYGLTGFPEIQHELDDEKSLGLIRETFTGRLE